MNGNAAMSPRAAAMHYKKKNSFHDSSGNQTMDFGQNEWLGNKEGNAQPQGFSWNCAIDDKPQNAIIFFCLHKNIKLILSRYAVFI